VADDMRGLRCLPIKTPAARPGSRITPL